MIRTLISAAAIAMAAVPAPAQTTAGATARPGASSRSETARSPIEAAARLADWQLSRMSEAGRPTDRNADPRTWELAAFWVGMTALADAGGPPRIRDAVLKMGRANGWRPGDQLYFADDLAITQPYLWSAVHGAGAAARGPTRERFNTILARPAVTTLAFYVPPEGYGKTECLTRWCWCDALFMAPAAFIELSRQTGDPRYRDFALKEFWATTDFLFDPAEHLYYRDSRFFEKRDDKGRKQFWARGNGWVFGGLARIIPLLPRGSADRTRLEALFRDMAARLVGLQKPDGYWAPSLLAAEASPPESSGTGFFTYGLAWGINTGVLPRARYEGATRRGWAALQRAVQPDGRLGYVQQVSDRPDKVERQDTHYYGVGAFLLAATEIAKLDEARR